MPIAKTSFIRDLRQLALPYWRSEERAASSALLFVILSLNLIGIGLSLLFNDWNKHFYNALQDKDLPEFQHQLLRFFWLASSTVAVAVTQTYLRQLLIIRWRRWLTVQYVDRWLAHRAYYRLQLGGVGADNPDQRIADDINNFVNHTLSLTLDLLTAIVTLLSFASILWTLSGVITVFGVEVRGYIFWVALVYSVAGTWLVAKIGWPLVNLNFQQQQVEADFRYSLVRVRENAEGVALYGGEAEEARGLNDRFADVIRNWRAIMGRQMSLNWFSTSYAQLAVVFPYLVAAPRYFAGNIQLGGLMQTASAFSTVQGALSWFVIAFSSIADWRARVNRLTSFRRALDDLDRSSERGAVKRKTSTTPGISIDGLDIWLPGGLKIIEDLNLRLAEGSRTLITGDSGSGKSTLFRVLAGLWPYCDGLLSFPQDERLLFLPQKPYLPIASLRVVATYPHHHEHHSDEEIKTALAESGLAHLCNRLDDRHHWIQLLSGGEQQRLAIVRALLIKPQWLFLDEATSNLDDESAAQLYQLLLDRLPNTGLISISHRPALAAFHGAHLVMSRPNAGGAAKLSAAPQFSHAGPPSLPRPTQP